MSDEQQVRLEGVIKVDVVALVGEDIYERWLAGEKEAGDIVGTQLSIAAREALEEYDGADVTIERAVLVEDDGYLGTDVAVLKKW